MTRWQRLMPGIAAWVACDRLRVFWGQRQAEVGNQTAQRGFRHVQSPAACAQRRAGLQHCSEPFLAKCHFVNPSMYPFPARRQPAVGRPTSSGCCGPNRGAVMRRTSAGLKRNIVVQIGGICGGRPATGGSFGTARCLTSFRRAFITIAVFLTATDQG